MGTGYLHAEVISQFLSGHLHAVQYNAGGSLANGMYVEIQPFLVQSFKDLRNLLRFKGSSSHHTGVCIRCDHCRRFNLHGTIHKDL